jgi:GNAT superfamily N-acetyltransferase
MATASDESNDGADEYTIRRYEPTDESAFLALFKQVFGHDASEAWFDWKYRRNPCFDGVPIIVAEVDGELVGARPFFTLPIRAGDRVLTGFQPGDTMVHPEHRRRGLFTRMTEWALDWLNGLDELDPFCFNFPNDQSKAGYLKLGWREVGTIPVWYRVENPAAFFEDADSLRGRLATLAGHGYLVMKDARAGSNSDKISIERRTQLPAAVLTSLYERHVPHRLHTRRTTSFYQWRFDTPEWRYRTYIATHSDDPIAGAVVGLGSRERKAVAQITDVVPLVGREANTEAYRRLTTAIIEDVDIDLLAATGTGLPVNVLSAYGFHRDDRFPFSALSTPMTLVARPTDSREWTLDGRNLTAASDWCLSFVEQDTS